MRQVFYFTAPWCQPCQALGPTMDKVSQQMPVEKINIDYEMDRARSAKCRKCSYCNTRGKWTRGS
jgi:thiol-disulfide isomerase/thioredoxin